MIRQADDRVVAVPLLGERSGGVGQVSSLLWRAVSETWPNACTLVPLLDERRVEPSIADKVEFGWTVGARQWAGKARWILFAHLGLARIERFIPSGVRAPYGVFLHGVEAWRRLSAADRDLLARAHVRLANSAFTARRVREVNPEVGDVEVCPLALAAEPGVDSDATPVERRTQAVLVVGRMSAGERYKGHEQLIDAWPAVVAQEPAAELVMVGDGDDRARLEARARASAAGHRIRFAGFVTRPELDDWYRRAAVFALPSRNEGFGLVYLEAMAHGLPCVGSIHDAAGEVIRHGDTGMLVDSDRPEEIAGAVTTLLGDADLRERMGRAGHARWQRHFSYARFREQAVSVIERALEGAPAGDRPA